MNNVVNPDPILCLAITPADFVVNLGAAGWVDTDVSATTGTDVRKVWIIVASVSGPQLTGARTKGSALAPTVTTVHEVTLFAQVDSTGHLELYRNAAANTTYRLIGYLQ